MQLRISVKRVVLLAYSCVALFASGLWQSARADIEQESTTEQWVVDQLRESAYANLSKLPENQRWIRATFLANLLLGRNTDVGNVNKIDINGALVDGDLHLENGEVRFAYVWLIDCTFASVNFSHARFDGNLELNHSVFKGGAYFAGTTIAKDFNVQRNAFFDQLSFEGASVAGNFMFAGCRMADKTYVTFENLHVHGWFDLAGEDFRSHFLLFTNARIDGDISLYDCAFFSQILSFEASHASEISFEQCDVTNVDFINLRRMQVDAISFKDNRGFSEPNISLDRMTFRLIKPANVEQLQFLLRQYDAEIYAKLEASFRSSGFPTEADDVFVAKKRAERKHRCPSFWRQCDSRGGYLLNLFEDALAGYGKRLQYLLYWSLGFILLGALVFRSENGMRTKDWKEMAERSGKYHPFWYSLDLFLPIIKLGEADLWTPRDNRRWANLYKKIHIIIGSLFVPIGLAAWTGIIK